MGFRSFYDHGNIVIGISIGVMRMYSSLREFVRQIQPSNLGSTLGLLGANLCIFECRSKLILKLEKFEENLFKPTFKQEKIEDYANI